MTFDEVIKKSKKEFCYEDNAFGFWTDTLKELQEEYAPTIEMTENEKKTFMFYVNNGTFFSLIERVHMSDDLDFVEVNEEFKKITDQELMKAWLHPETIKVINS